ncbi:MAG TPA: hypothetical protein VGZ22_16400 [Isosphaeraceae bacterium]|jgi:hypothetical protein|nr:hypothetical protein [Isosphaeraceae bacterium]
MQDFVPQKDGHFVIELLLVETTIPSKALECELHLPATATLLFKKDSLRAEIAIREPEFEDESSESESPRTAPIDLQRGDVLRITLGGTWSEGRRVQYPTAIIAIRDPGGVEEELYLTFASSDAFNPNYWLKALAKILKEEWEVSVQQSKGGRAGGMNEQPPGVGDDDIPF